MYTTPPATAGDETEARPGGAVVAVHSGRQVLGEPLQLVVPVAS
jgi:hypothetical protein